MLEVRSVFLDISKAFYKVSHKWFIFKLEQNGIYGDLLNILRDFLSNRKQKVFLYGQVSSWTSVNVGDQPGSLLVALLLLIYINDNLLYQLDNLSPNVKLFADNISLFSVTHDINVSP